MYGQSANETSSQASSASQLYPYHQQGFQRFAQHNHAAHYADYIEQSWPPAALPPVQPIPKSSFHHPVSTGPRRFSDATQPVCTYESPNRAYYPGPSVPLPVRYTNDQFPMSMHTYGGPSQSQSIPYRNESNASQSQSPGPHPSSSAVPSQRSAPFLNNQSHSVTMPSVPYARPSVPQLNASYSNTFPPHQMPIAATSTYPSQQSHAYTTTTPQHIPPYINSQESFADSHPSPPRLPMQRAFASYTNGPSEPQPSIPHAGVHPTPAFQSGSYEAPVASIDPNPLPITTAPEPQRVGAPLNSDGTSTDDDEEMAMAMAMSQMEMAQKREEEIQRSNQEEADLARALKESLQTVETSHLFGGESSRSRPSLSQSKGKYRESPQLPVNVPSPDALDTFQVPHGSATSKITTSYGDDTEFGLENYKKWHIPAVSDMPQESRSNGVMRANSLSSIATGPPASTPPHASTHSSSSPLSQVFQTLSSQRYGQLPDQLSSSLAALESFQQTESAESRLVFDDEAYARQLAAEEEEELQNRLERKAMIASEREQPEAETLPQYTTEGILAPDLQSDDSHSNRPQLSPNLPAANATLPGTTITSAPRPAASLEHVQHSSLQSGSEKYQGHQSAPRPSLDPVRRRSSLQSREKYQGHQPAPRPATSVEAAKPQSSPQIRSEQYQGQSYDSRSLLQTGQSSSTILPSAQSFSEPLPVLSDRPYSHLNPLRPATNNASTPPSAAPGSSNAAQINHVPSAGLLNSNNLMDYELLKGVCEFPYFVFSFLLT